MIVSEDCLAHPGLRALVVTGSVVRARWLALMELEWCAAGRLPVTWNENGYRIGYPGGSWARFAAVDSIRDTMRLQGLDFHRLVIDGELDAEAEGFLRTRLRPDGEFPVDPVLVLTGMGSW